MSTCAAAQRRWNKDGRNEMIGIITATEEEYEALGKSLAHAAVCLEACGMTFLKGSLDGREVVGVQAGIGKVNAAVCTQLLIERFHPQVIINVGVAGALNEALHVGDIVISQAAAQHDFDTTFFGDAPGFVSGPDQIYFQADEKLIQAAQRAAEELAIPAHCGCIVTGDQFVADPDKKKWLVQQFAGDCTEMEGGAVAQTCTLNKVPFVIIRAISDGASDEAPMQYEEFVNFAAARAMHMIQTMMKYF
ncbi:MAG: 5'-methylthioadenosine/adenosylhomocysteine nucleosidase [Lachnospiraceae bacterium]|jgi:adenosylhomocysteine nucleosidase|nr:5'-methylthioadenosine/adenosylhomocysteine nucleosidase [Lachnospiraceae bacterium]